MCVTLSAHNELFWLEHRKSLQVKGVQNAHLESPMFIAYSLESRRIHTRAVLPLARDSSGSSGNNGCSERTGKERFFRSLNGIVHGGEGVILIVLIGAKSSQKPLHHKLDVTYSTVRCIHDDMTELSMSIEHSRNE